MDDFLFDLRGYLLLRNAIDSELIERLRAEFDAFPTDLDLGAWYRGAQRRDYNSFSGYELHHAVEIGGPFEELVDHPSWIEHVRHYCGEEDSYVAGVFIDECIAMVRGQGSHHPMHSGGWRSPLRCRYLYEHGRFRCSQVNVIVAIDDIGPDDGPTTVIPGSHKSNLPHPEVRPNDYHAGTPIDGVTGTEAVTMKAGDAVLFTDAIMHGGATRTAPGFRRTVLYRYGVSWGRTRYGYEYSRALLDRLNPQRRRILEPQPPIREGERRLPVEIVEHEHAEFEG